MKRFLPFFGCLLLYVHGDINEQRKHHVSTSFNIRFPVSLEKNLLEEEEGYIHTDALFGVPFLQGRSVFLLLLIIF